MRGSLTKTRVGAGVRWEAVVDLPPGPDGQRRQRRRRFETKREADAWLAEINHQLNTGSYVDPATVTLREYLADWLSDHGTNLRETTLSTYRGLIRNHIDPALGDIPVSKLTPMHLQSFYREKLESGRRDGKDGGLASSTVRQMHAILYRALKTAIQLKMLSSNPADAVEAPRPAARQREMNFLTAEQVRQLFQCADEGSTYYPVYHLAVFTGLRRGELLALRWEDVDLDGRTASIRRALTETYDGKLIVQPPKTRTGNRTIALSKEATRLLRRQRIQQTERRLQLGPAWEDADLIITTEDGRAVNPANLHRHFKKTLKQAGLPRIRFHDLRHTHATLMLQQGEHPKVVSERLGHNNIQITLDTYSHALPNLQAEAVDRLDRTIFAGENPASGTFSES